VNLVCKAVLETVTDMDNASEEDDVAAVTYNNVLTDPYGEAVEKDPIAVICSVV
jgi:hypothetical protein